MPAEVIVTSRPLSSAFVYHWLFWYIASLPFTVVTVTSRISRANAPWFLTNIHDDVGLLNLMSGLVALSQPIFAVVLFLRLPQSSGLDAAAKGTLFVLSLVTCAALFLAATGA